MLYIDKKLINKIVLKLIIIINKAAIPYAD